MHTYRWYELNVLEVSPVSPEAYYAEEAWKYGLSQIDLDHLWWLYDRLVNVHGENKNYDYMLKFEKMINFIKYEVKL